MRKLVSKDKPPIIGVAIRGKYHQEQLSYFSFCPFDHRWAALGRSRFLCRRAVVLH